MAASTPIKPSLAVSTGPAPSARRTRRSSSSSRSWREMACTPTSRATKTGDGPEGAEGDRLWFEGQFYLGNDPRGGVEHESRTRAGWR